MLQEGTPSVLQHPGNSWVITSDLSEHLRAVRPQLWLMQPSGPHAPHHAKKNTEHSNRRLSFLCCISTSPDGETRCIWRTVSTKGTSVPH